MLVRFGATWTESNIWPLSFKRYRLWFVHKDGIQRASSSFSNWLVTSLRRFELAHLLAFYCFRFPRTAHCTIWPTFRAIREFLLVSRTRMISTVVSLQVEQRRGLTFGTGGGYRLLLSNVYEYGWTNSKVTKFRLATTRRFPAGWHGWAWLLFFQNRPRQQPDHLLARLSREKPPGGIRF